QLEDSDLDLVISGTKDAILMIEGFAREMPEERMLEALEVAHNYVREICDLQNELFQQVKVEKRHYEIPAGDGMLDKLKAGFYTELRAAKQTAGKQDRAEAVSVVKKKASEALVNDPNDAAVAHSFSKAWHDMEEIAVRDLILAGT